MTDGFAFTVRQQWEAWCHKCGWHAAAYSEGSARGALDSHRRISCRCR